MRAYLGKYGGIKVYLHLSFFLIFPYVAFINYQNGAGLGEIFFQCLLTVAVFFCVLLHEFGHALAARRYGIHTRQIVLLPIGGVAQLESMPEKPSQELAVALAGPAVNLGIVIILFPIVWAMYGLSSILGFIQETNQLFLVALLWVNAVLLVFNLVPAFPMDGGRVLRALLAFRLSYPDATLIAARLGQILALGFLLAPFYFHNYIWILLGIFVIVSAEMEYRMVSRRYKYKGIKVRDAMLQHYSVLHPLDTLDTAVNALMAGNEKHFAVAEDRDLKGILTHKVLMEALEQHGKAAMVGAVMLTAIPRLRPDQPAEEALGLMGQYEIPLLPVMDGLTWIGMVDKDNIIELGQVRRTARVIPHHPQPQV